MSVLRDVNIRTQDSPSIDAFGRWRVSEPHTLFDSKQIFDNLPLFYDDQEVSGSGTTSVHSTDLARSRMSVALNTAGVRVRQTFMRFNYQPGKSQLVKLTGILNAVGGGSGIIQRIGYFDDDNGLFFENNAGTINVVRRTKTSGSPVDNAVAQSAWNLDTMDGTDSSPSGVTLDFTKAQQFAIDFEWLAVGRIRYGVKIGAQVINFHEVNAANILDVVYMSTPDLPIRYEIRNDGTGAASSLDHICATVVSEGGQQETGVLQYHSTGGTHVDANVENTIYAVVGIRLKAASIGCTIDLRSFTMLAETGADFEWLVIFNPTVAGTFTYSNKTNSCLQTALGAIANTVTLGSTMAGGFASTTGAGGGGGGGTSGELGNTRRLGAAIDGTVDEIVLCVRPLGANLDIQGSLEWREAL